VSTARPSSVFVSTSVRASAAGSRGIDARGPGAARTRLARAQAATQASPQLTTLRPIRSTLASRWGACRRLDLAA